jgi:predicted branched-subunit amino acid permease
VPGRPTLRTPEERTAVRQAVSVAVATGLYGVSFGALSVAAGLDVLQTMALSLLMFSGGSQFAFIGVVGAGGAPLAAVATAGLLGARNGLYGVQVAPLLGAHGWRRPLAAQLTIDESTAVGTAQRTPAAIRTGFWWAGAGVFVLWNVFTLVGAVLGDALGDPTRYGLDAAAAAAFLGLLWPRLAGRLAQATAAAALVVALALTPVVPAGIPVLAAAVVAIVLGWTSTGRPAAAPGSPASGSPASGSPAPGRHADGPHADGAA